MKILLDENLPTKLKYNFSDKFEIHTVKDMGWVGKKNGELLGQATFNEFDIFLTLDKNLKHQQSIYKFDLKFIVLLSIDNKHQTLQPYIEKVKDLLNNLPIPKISEISLSQLSYPLIKELMKVRLYFIWLISSPRQPTLLIYSGVPNLHTRL